MDVMVLLKAVNSFRGIIERCYSKGSHAYSNYGGRGISVDEELLLNPTLFTNWYQENYFDNSSVERIDNDGNYSLSNIKMATSLEQNRNRRNSVKLKAFNETKSLMEWIDDERCVITSYHTLLSRIKSGWDSEKVLTTPIKKEVVSKANSPIIVNDKGKRAYLITAFGESKSASEWLVDERNYCKDRTTLNSRLNQGVEPEIAMAKDYKEIRYAKSSESQRAAGPKIEAFGESKSLMAWVDDERCQAAKNTLWYRIDCGWDAETAITTPGRVLRNYGTLEAFGETKSVGEWAKDERCLCAYSTLTKRLAAGHSLETAMTTPPTRGRKPNML